MKRKILLVCLLSCLIFSCKNSNEKFNYSSSSKKIRGGFDNGRFIDFTLKTINSSSITKEDFLYLTENNIYSNSISQIQIDDSFVKVMTKENNKSIQFEYEYKIVSSTSVLYLIPLDYSKLNLYIDGKKENVYSNSNLSYMIILSGFGENRIEISEYAKDICFIKNGTYWKM